MENNNLDPPTATTIVNKKEQPKHNLLDNINQGMVNNMMDGQKQHLKQHKLKIVEKTQRIKKDKKQKKNLVKNEYYSKAEIEAFQNQIIFDAINRLRNRNANSSDQHSLIHKKLTRQRLLQFLQLIEQEYSITIAIYLQSNINKELVRFEMIQSGNLKKLLLKFIDRTIQAFPVLNNIVYRYAFQYYKTGPLQYRFEKLMEKTITPILNHASQQFLNEKNQQVQDQINRNKREKSIDNKSTQISKSPERQLLEEFQEENKKKLEKKKRKKIRKMQEKQIIEQSLDQSSNKKQMKIQAQLPKQYEDLSKLLQNLNLDQNRTPCRIDQVYLQKWRNLTIISKNKLQSLKK